MPVLRFPEFEGSWNELKFNKLIQLISGQHLSPHEYSLDSGETPYFTDTSDFTNDISRITKWTKYSEKSAKKGDILITVKGNGVGEMLFLHLPCVAMGRQLMAIRPIAVVGEILYQKLFTYRQQFQALASGNVIPGLSRPDILTTKICLPELKEQEKIVSFLGAVDTRLTQLRCKHKLVQTYKRGVMQKLFSQQIRFKGDDGEPFPDWEEKKLGQLLTIRYGKDHKDLEDGNYPVLGSGGIMRYVNSYLYDQPSILIGRKGTIDKPQFVTYPFWTVDTLFYSEISPDLIPYFLFLVVQSINWQKYNEATGVPSLNTLSINNVKVIIPPDKKEQAKIANFLTVIDQKLEAIAKQIELTEQFKKSLLQKMFV